MFYMPGQMIIFVGADKPLQYSPKGYPKRLNTLLQYQQEIECCYRGSSDPLLVNDIAAGE